MTLQSFMAQPSIKDVRTLFLDNLANQNVSFTGKQGSGCTPLLIHQNLSTSYYPTKLLEYLIKGNQTIVISGSQGSGKTSLMMSLIEQLDPKLRISTLPENSVYIQKLYPTRNVVPFQGTYSSSTLENLDVKYKSDYPVSIFDEIANQESTFLNHYFNSLFSIFTHYGKELSDIVGSLRNSFIQKGLCDNEKNAEQLIVNLLDFNIHIVRNEDGSRYIERITECVPLESKGNRLYEARNIVELREGKYVPLNPISTSRQEVIMHALSDEDKVEFREFTKLYWVDEN
ncbi:hypothetical protein ACQKNX_22490 [Lysinibacillus sp. NPDC093712]|uniref:hypothetical protein n=1 Tax=Lysinibacillus sp. NPDC093712 TaxID=3390579 RepID=UPI003D08CF60